MPRKRPGRIGRPRQDPQDPQLEVNPHRVRAALLFSGLSQREVVEEARRQKLAPLTVKGIHNLSTFNQRTSRRSRLEAIAQVTNVTVHYLTEKTEGDLLDALARGFAIANWDTYRETVSHPGEVFRKFDTVTADARVLLDLRAWRARCDRSFARLTLEQQSRHLTREEREDFAVKNLGVLREVFGRERSTEALRSYRKWLEGSEK